MPNGDTESVVVDRDFVIEPFVGCSDGANAMSNTPAVTAAAPAANNTVDVFAAVIASSRS